jgi:hypothetical protein
MEDLLHFMAIETILRLFGIFCGHLVYFMVIGIHMFSRFGILHQEKSGNPGPNVTAFRSLQTMCTQNFVSPNVN